MNILIQNVSWCITGVTKSNATIVIIIIPKNRLGLSTHKLTEQEYKVHTSVF